MPERKSPLLLALIFWLINFLLGCKVLEVITVLISLHNLLRTPKNGIMMEVLGRIKPQMKLHFSPNYSPVPTSSDVNVGLQSVRLPKCCPKKFYVHFIMEPRVSFVVR